MDIPVTIQKNIPLAPRTTLGVGGSAEYFTIVDSLESLRDAMLWAKENTIPVTILGGGSNVLIADRGISGLVLVPNLSDISYQSINNETRVTAGAGVVLDALIKECIEKGLWGLENLSAIPGTVGAVPIQNVGAYGVEACDIIQSVLVYDTDTDSVYHMDATQCAFGYRDSIFKHETGKKYIIVNVTFALSKSAHPKISYRDLASFFGSNTSPSLIEIRDAVIKIRSKKFPDWHVVGTAGSFFKNPVVAKEVFMQLKKEYPDLPGYEMGGGNVKVSLGWVLDRVCNLKGYKEGSVGLYEAQALVLVCEKGMSATTVELFSDSIIEKIQKKIGIVIEREVTLLK